VKTLETTPPGETHWSTRSMAKAAGVSHTLVGRIWRTFRLQPHRSESFKLSPDPQLVEKIRDVVGLYVAPPANAMVFSVDEKSQIQALQPAQPILPMDVGQPERRTHNYVRHGTLEMWFLFWALLGALIGISAAQRRGFSVATGVIGGLLLGPLAFLMYFVSGVTRGDATRKCPYCAEWIKAEAKVCKHCRHGVPPAGFEKYGPRDVE
jgi:hypothetical protein